VEPVHDGFNDLQERERDQAVTHDGSKDAAALDVDADRQAIPRDARRVSVR
jgi:hypothetical protein